MSKYYGSISLIYGLPSFINAPREIFDH